VPDNAAMKPGLRDEEPGPAWAGQAHDGSAGREPPAGERGWRAERVSVPGNVAWTMSLLEEAGQTEEGIAATLRAAAEAGDSGGRRAPERAARKAHQLTEARNAAAGVSETACTGQAYRPGPGSRAACAWMVRTWSAPIISSTLASAGCGRRIRETQPGHINGQVPGAHHLAPGRCQRVAATAE